MLPEQDTLIEKLYREFFTQLWIYAKAELEDPEQAQEVVQDTFHEAVRHIDILLPHGSPQEKNHARSSFRESLHPPLYLSGFRYRIH